MAIESEEEWDFLKVKLESYGNKLKSIESNNFILRTIFCSFRISLLDWRNV